MWRWLRLLTGWHMRDWLAHTFSSLPLVTAPQVRSLRISWKKNGLEFDTVPVLGTADEIIVRAELRYSSSTPARKADLRLRVGRQNVPPESLVLAESAGRLNIHVCEFRLEPLENSETVELCWQGQLLCQAALPVLPLRQFVEQLQLVQTHPCMLPCVPTPAPTRLFANTRCHARNIRGSRVGMCLPVPS
jgi:hypothetical protein